MNEILIGIDCATVNNKIGVALGRLESKGVIVEVCQVCSAEEKAADIIVRWLRDTRASRALLAIDAPLGWPKDLSLALADHRAGRHISIDSNEMFCRKTD